MSSKKTLRLTYGELFLQIRFIFRCSHITRQAQYNHPCLTSCYLYTTAVKPIIPGPAHTQFNPHSALVPANPYLLEEIPPWLIIYVNGNRKCLAFSDILN